MLTNKTTTGLCALFLMTALTLVVVGCHQQAAPPPSRSGVIAGTSLIADMIADLSPEQVQTFTLLPSNACPSQFDMKASDIQQLQQASLVILHPWQLNLANIRRVIEAAKIAEGRMHVMDVPGNWMLPSVQLHGLHAVGALLSEQRPELKTEIEKRARLREERIAALIEEVQQQLAELSVKEVTVLCQEMQEPFMRELGLNVASVFRRPEDWSVADVEQLVRLGRDVGVKLVVDNLQSGGQQMSATLARDMDAVHVVLSNFPGGFPDTPTWEAAYRNNVQRIADAIHESRKAAP